MGRPLGGKNTNKVPDTSIKMFTTAKDKMDFQKSMEKTLMSIG